MNYTQTDMHTYIGGWRDNQLAEETQGECVSKEDSTGILKKYSTDVYYWQCELEIIIRENIGVSDWWRSKCGEI